MKSQEDLRQVSQREYNDQPVPLYNAATTQDWRTVETATFLDTVGDIAGLRVLDLACGNGRATRMLAERKAALVIGIDNAQAMIDDALRIEREQPLGNVRYQLGDIFELPLVEAGNFDLVTAVFALHYAPSADFLKRCLRSAFDNLKPGGRLVIVGGHMDRFTHLSPTEINQRYSVVGFKTTYEVWPPIPFSRVQYEIFEGNPAEQPECPRLFHLLCSWVPRGVYEQLCKEVGFNHFEQLSWSYPGRKEGRLDAFFERVIDVEPHMCCVASKAFK